MESILQDKCGKCPNWRNCVKGYNPLKFRCPTMSAETYARVLKKVMIPLPANERQLYEHLLIDTQQQIEQAQQPILL